MKRILLICIGIIALPILALALLAWANADKISAALTGAVEKATGRPLTLDAPPRLSFFPKIGVSLGKAAWGNAEEGLSVTILHGEARVALMPLFSGKIAISEILLDSPQVLYDATAQAPAAHSGGAKPSPAARQDSGAHAFSLPQFSLASLEIRNGTLRYKNRNSEVLVQKLELTASDLSNNGRGSIQVRGLAEHKTAGGNTAPALEFSGETALLLSDALFTLEATKIEARLAGQKDRLTLSGTGPVSYTPENGVVSLAGIDAAVARESGPLFTVHAAGTLQSRSLEAELLLRAEGSPKALLEACGVSFTPGSPTALTSLDLSAGLQATPAQVRLSDLKGDVDGASFLGEATLVPPQSGSGAAGGPLRLKARLALGDFNIDPYLPSEGRTKRLSESPVASASSAASAPENKMPVQAGQADRAGQASPAVWPELDIELTANQIIASGIRLDKVRAVLAGSGGRYELRPASFTFYEGPTTLTGEADLAALPPRYAMSLKTDNARLAPLLKDAAGTSGIDGRVSLSTSLKALGPKEAGTDMGAAILRSLNGVGTVEGKELLVKAGIIPSSVTDKLKVDATRKEGFAFSRLAGRYAVTNGQMTLSDVILTGNAINAEAAGNIDLPGGNMDIRTVVKVAGIGVPVNVSGPLAKPAYKVDSGRLLLNTVEGVLKGGKEAGTSGRDAGKALKNLLGF